MIASVLEAAPDGLDGFIPLAGLGGGSAPDLLITRLNYFGTVELVEGLRPALAKKSGAVVLLCSNSAPMFPADEAFVESLLAGMRTRRWNWRRRYNREHTICRPSGRSTTGCAAT